MKPVLILLLFLGVVVATYESTNPGGGGAFNSPIICSSFWILGSDLGGLYISDNKGDSWYAVGSENGGLESTHISSLACTNQRLIVGTDNGIFVGNLDGTSLQHVSPGGYVAAVVVTDGDSNVVYATKHPTFNGSAPQVFKSTNGGQSFFELAATGLPASFRVVGMRSHPVDSDSIWIISGEGRFATTEPAAAYITTDGGASFFRLDPQRGQVVDLAYAWDESNLNKLFVTTVENEVGHVFMSPDTGFGEWTELSSGQTGVILADRTNSNHVRLIDYNYRSLTTETLLWESFNGGTSWTRFSNTVEGGWSQADEDWGLSSSFQGNLQTIGFRPDQPNEILWSNSQFIYASTDGGKTWFDVVSNEVSNNEFRSRGIDNVVPIVIEPSDADSNIVYTGYLDMGIWRSDDGGESWKSLNPDAQWSHNWGGKGGNTLSIKADPDRANVVWAQVAGDLDDPIHLLKSTNRGDTWSELTSGLPSSPGLIESIEIDPNSPVSSRRLWLIASGDVYVSSDDGSSWSLSLSCGDCVGIRYTPSTLFAFGPSGVFRSATGSSSWTAVSLPAAASSGWTRNQHWLLDLWSYAGPIDLAWRGNSELWLAIQSQSGGGGVYYSSNSGTTWTRVYTNSYVRSVAVDPDSNEVVVGSSSALTSGGYDPESVGVIVHSNGQTSSGWISENDNLAWQFCTFVTVSSSGRRWIISPGEGVLVKEEAGGAAFCLSGRNVVTEKARGQIAMDSLQVGDEILVSAGKYEEVYAFGHRDQSRTAEFLQLLPSNLEVSHDHMIFMMNGKAIPASIVKVGDTLMSGEIVTDIKVISRRGIYAPFTVSGTFIANDIVVSSYVAFQDSATLRIGSISTGLTYQWMARTFEVPHRLWCAFNSCADERNTTSGISSWVETPLKLALWFVAQEWYTMVLVMMPLMLMMGALALVDIAVRFPLAFPLALLVLGVGRSHSFRIKSVNQFD